MDWGKLLFPRRSKFGRKTSGVGKPPYIERRRGHRVLAAMPVFIYGHTLGMPFFQHTETANISVQGGLFSLSVKVARSQKLLVTNVQTNEDLVCRVVRFAKSEQGQPLIGVEFLQPSPQFWSVEFGS
jgi:hypothetical protein